MVMQQPGREDKIASKGSVPDLIRHLHGRYNKRITGDLSIAAKKGDFREFPDDLNWQIVDALRSRGINKLYSHQEAAWRSVQAKQDTVVVTPTASGKTLCYNLPVLQAILQDKAKALYLFPTKALSQDQVAEILELNKAADLGVRAYTFDGDTPGDARKAVRTRGDIVVSNPDMLHQGILPHHTKWAQFFENLHFIVVDELHIYRGVFGSHMANVLRRLRRVCQFYGAKPVFIFCSATIANPGELATKLIESPVTTIAENGSPHGEKRLLLWNPPEINPDLGIRASARSQTTRIAKMAVERGLKSIVFARSRIMVEVITKYLKDTFDRDPRKPKRVSSYRGGYLPTDRRETEKNLRGGRVDCVVATSALELGVDIGSLDVCILNGYPGTVAGTWQRLGRAGRRNRPALGVMVASSSPLDQFIVRNPEFFLGASPESARIAPDQLLILVDHVRCAAFELPFTDGDRFGGENLIEILELLAEEGVVHHEGRQWHWSADSYPANSVSLRSVAEGNFVVIDTTAESKKVIAEVDYSAAPMTLYEGAIYMIQANEYQVDKLDWDGRKAFVSKTMADYYTDAIDYTRLKILDDFDSCQMAKGECAHGEVHLIRRVAGYKKIRYHTHENVGFGKINLPDQEMHTTSVWWSITADALESAFVDRSQALDGFLGAAYALHTVVAVFSMSEPQDIGRAVGDGNATWFATTGSSGRGAIRNLEGESSVLEDESIKFRPTVFLYDNYPGGVGLSAPFFDAQAELIAKAQALVKLCSCPKGCPACIGPILASDEQRGFSPKTAALQLLNLLAVE